MISIDTARSGHPVLRKNGRLLGSSFDPVKEASAWATKARASLDPGATAFILGAGSGYHVSALAAENTSGQLIVVESDAEVAVEAARIAAIPSNVRMIVEPEWANLAAHGAFADALGGSYAILKYGPSCQIDQAYFAGVEAFLLGRDKVAFLLQLRARPELAALLDPAEIEKIGDAPVSIKTLQGLFGPQAVASRERQIWKILEELVV